MPGGSLSPGLAEMTALAGAETWFARAAALLASLAGVTLSARTVERSAEASGAAAGSQAKPAPPRSSPTKLLRTVDELKLWARVGGRQ